MAEVSAPAVPSNELLEWPKKDKRRILHAVYRVGDLDRTIKYVVQHNEILYKMLILFLWSDNSGIFFFFFCSRFYTECFGMKLLRKRDIPEEKYSNAFLGFGPEESQFVVELTYSKLKAFVCLLTYGFLILDIAPV